jgi:hypothetical protein
MTIGSLSERHFGRWTCQIEHSGSRQFQVYRKIYYNIWAFSVRRTVKVTVAEFSAICAEIRLQTLKKLLILQ